MMKRFLLLLVAASVCLPLFARKNEFHKNVVEGKNGYIWIKGIPQVSQKRDYCVPACISMVVRYFDSKTTQKKLSGLFNDAKMDSLTESYIESFANAQELQEFSLQKIYALSEKEYDHMMLLYHSASKKKRQKRDPKEGGLSNVFDNVNRDVAKKVFPSARPNLAVTMDILCTKYINAGVPILWSVAMNLDPNVKMKGGHMRIIVGYTRQNGRIRKILYRDPWGGNTKYKQVDFDDAQTMTMQIYVLQPKLGSDMRPSTTEKHYQKKTIQRKLRGK